MIGSSRSVKKVAWGEKSGLSIFSTDFEAYERDANTEYNLLFD